MKENDYFLNVLENPDFDPRDFKNVGLTMENTSLESKETYKEIEAIRNNPIFQTDGKFDEAKYNKAYDLVSTSFKVFSDSYLIDKISSDKIFSKYDIFAPEDRRDKEEVKITRTINPLREQRGLLHTTDVQESPLSVRENAQTQLVWDSVTKEWQDSPNDAFFKNFKETRVLAQWDEDGTHRDLITGELVQHKKGEKKLNENGTYYYENLNGRDIYGREVLSKFDVLTVDGSAWNKFDFFDSDDKDPNIAKTLVRTAVKVAPAFIPGVNTWYIGARMVMNVTELLAKVGKVFGGNDNPTLSEIEGFVESLSFTSSDYARGSQEANKPAHVWSLENILNMAGDVFLQLAEQRWLFEYGPSLFMGSAGYSDEAMSAVKKKQLIETNKQYQALRLKTLFTKGEDVANDVTKIMNTIQGDELMNAYMKQYQNLGKYISQVYMTGIVAAEAYGDAKMQGLTDEEASALTIGYALLEYGLLSTDIGRWVLPELKAQKQQYAQLVRTLVTDKNRVKPDITASTTEKRKWLNKLVQKGREFARATYDPTASTLKTAIGGALAEGIEETSEELLYDLAKSMFNLSKYMSGEDPKLKVFEDVFNRYALSFVGGALGGGLMTVRGDYRQAKQMASLDKQQAYQMLVHIIDQGEAEQFMKTARKMTWDSPDLAAWAPKVSGVDQYVSGDSKNNRNIAAIDALQQEVNMIENILKANGGTVSDDSLISILTSADSRLRLTALQNSNFMPQYLQEFNTLQTQIVNLSNEIIKLEQGIEASKRSDSDSPNATVESNNKQLIADKKSELKKLVEQKEELLSGKRNLEFIERAAFEMSQDLAGSYLDSTFIQYAESEEKTDITEISESRLDELKNKWLKRKQHVHKDDLERAFRTFKKVNPKASELIKKHVEDYFENQNNLFNIIQTGFGKVTDVQGLALQATLEGNPIDADELVLDVPGLKVGKGEDFNLATNGLTLFYAQLADALGLEPLQEIESLPASEQSEIYLRAVAGALDTTEGLKYLEDQITKAKFISAPERQFLLDLFKSVTPLVSNWGKLGELTLKIDKKPYSPTTDLLDIWNITTKADWKTSDLIKFLEDSTLQQYENKKLSDLTVGSQISEAIRGAIGNAKLLRSAIVAARTDNVSETNIVGYNVLINSLDSKSDLATIDKYTADVILQDLNRIITTLEYYKRLNALNTGQKLKENSRLDTKITYLFYDRLRTLFNAPDFPPSDWEGVDELRQAFNSLEILSDASFERELDLTKQQRVALKRDRFKYEDAVHTFLRKNAGRDLYELFNEKRFNFSSPDESVLNLETERISDVHLMFYMSSLDIIGGTDFYKLYLHSIPDNLAPLPGQELATRIGLASMLDGERLSKYIDAHTKALSNTSLDHRVKEFILPNGDKRKEKWSNNIDSDVSIDFYRTILIDGIAGSGKTTAVMRSVFSMLQHIESAKHVLDDVWFVNTTFERASKMATDLGYPQDEAWLKAHCFDNETFLAKISQQYQPKTFTNGQLTMSEDQVVEGDRFLKWNYQINKSAKAPSMIIIDEVGRFSQQDLLLIDDYSEYFGIMNFAAGDFEQVSLHGSYLKSQEDKVESQLYSGNFVGAPKLGVSMRVSSRLLDYNIKHIRAKLKQLKEGEFVEALKFKYYDDGNSPLLGWYNTENDIENPDSIKEKIERWIKTLEPGKKIGYVHNSPDNVLHEVMQELKHAYPDKFDDKPGGTSQGEENDFYVVNFDKADLNDEQYWELAYTGLTRAIKGVIFNLDNCQDSVQSNDTSEYSLGEQEIIAYQKEYKSVLKEALGDDVELPKLEYRKFGGEVAAEEQTPDVAVGIKFIDDEGEVHTVVEVNGSTITYMSDSGDVGTIEQGQLDEMTIITSDQDSEDWERYNQNKFIKIDNTKDDEFNMILHSMTTHETGAQEDDNGMLIPSNDADERVDSINGIVKLCNAFSYDIKLGSQSVHEQKQLLLLLDSIKSKLLYSKFKPETLREVFKTVFKDTPYDFSQMGDTEVEYVFECTPTVKTKTRGFKSAFEKLRKIFSKGRTSTEPNIKNITAVIKQDGQVVLKVPLLNLSNFKSLIKTFSPDAQKYIEENSTKDTLSQIKALVYFKQLRPEEKTPSLDLLKTFQELWERMDANLSFVIKNENDKPITKLSELGNPLGMTISTRRGEGGQLEYDGEYISIEEYQERTNNVVTNVYGAIKEILTQDNQILIEAGKPFILVSDNMDLAPGIMLKAYIDYHKNPVGKTDPGIKLIYTVPPTASLQDYLDNFLQFITGTKDTRKKTNNLIGTELTNYRLLSMIFKDGSFKETIQNRFPKTMSQEVIDQYLADYDAFVKKFEELDEKYKNLSSRQFIDYLRGKNELQDFTKDLKRVDSASSWKNLINSYFKFLVLGTYQDSNGSMNYTSTAPQVKILETIMGKNNWDGIYYHLIFKKDGTNYLGVKEMDYDIHNPIFKSNPVKINGKADSQSFVANIKMILDSYNASKNPEPPKQSSLNVDKVRTDINNSFKWVALEGTVSQSTVDSFIEDVINLMQQNNVVDYDTKTLINYINSLQGVLQIDPNTFLVDFSMQKDSTLDQIKLDDGRVYRYENQQFIPVTQNEEQVMENNIEQETTDQINEEQNNCTIVRQDDSDSMSDEEFGNISSFFGGNTSLDEWE